MAEKNNRKRLLYALVLLLVVALVAWLANRGGNRFSWRETYRTSSKAPYGTYAIYQLIQNYNDPETCTTLEDSLADQLPLDMLEGPANYVFVGEGMYMRPQDRDELLGFVSAGHTAFISTKVLPYDLMFHLYYHECDYEPWDGLVPFADSTVQLNFDHPELKRDHDFSYTFIQDFKATSTYWNVFPDNYFCGMERGLVPQGYLNDSLANLVRVPYGEGQFYLHTTPRVFTNYFLVKEEGRAYATRALSYLNDGPIYWDGYSGIPESMANRQNDPYRNTSPERRLQSESPLQYVLEQPPLAWAWYLLISLGLLYMLFRTRRRQRIIPVKDPNKNSSLQFVTTIGRLYYQKSGHQQVAEQAIKLLRTHVWERYGLQWRDKDDTFVRQLSARSGVDATLIEAIAKDVHNIPHYTSLVEGELIKFHQRVERFYAEAK